ncbi:MAG: hypothetical protein KC731_19085 [Myxococcales bacterium]|nr:hypothetical protein [Myxococcales bacterium]
MLAKLEDTYRNASSYTDSGTLEVSLAGQPTWSTDFETAFVRDTGLAYRMSLANSFGCFELVGTDDWAFSHLPRKPWRNHESLPDAIASLTGVTYGGAFYVPRLLIPAIGGRPVFGAAGASAFHTTVAKGSHGMFQLAVAGPRNRLIVVLLQEDPFVIREFVEYRDVPTSGPASARDLYDGRAAAESTFTFRFRSVELDAPPGLRSVLGAPNEGDAATCNGRVGGFPTSPHRDPP